MSTNALGGVNLTVIAQECLPVLQARLAPFALFTTDFSSEVAAKGSAVATRIPASMTAADYSRSTGYVASDATCSIVTVTLDKHKQITVGFDDSEVGNASLATLQRTFVQPLMNGICNAIQNDTLALITTAFPAYYSASYGSFGFTGVTAGAKVLDISGSNTPRAMLLGVNTYYDVLDDIKGVYSTGADALRQGKVGELANVSIAPVFTPKFNGLSSTQAAGLAGFIGGQDALCIAARLPNVPIPTGGMVENITDPNSGFTVQLRQWYSWDDGMWKMSAIAIYGVSRGNTSSGARIITTD
jgi:hypothetical protein